jgi:thioredoxin-like negative regulator of GroEL
MQALKKAERAKQNALPDDELDKPSEAFDEILALTPEPQLGAVRPGARREFNSTPEPGTDGRRAPAAPPVAASSEPRPSPSPLPAASDHKEPGMTLDFALDPSDPVNAATRLLPPRCRPTMRVGAGAHRRGRNSAPPRRPSPCPPRCRPRPRQLPRGTRSQRRRPPQQRQPANRRRQRRGSVFCHPGGDKPRAPRARARAAATAEPAGIDPERLRDRPDRRGAAGGRLWPVLARPERPRRRRRLPPVPMPPPGATGATPAQVVVAALGHAAPPARPGRQRRPDAGPDRHQPRRPAGAGTRRAKTEQELAAARGDPGRATRRARAPQLPPLARRTTATSASPAASRSPVAPALDGAYKAFNSGDWPAAQQQYDAALNQDPNNRDALLGLAAVGAPEPEGQGRQYYLRLLELSPNDGAATAGLIGLRQGDISRSEARLKAILATNPGSGAGAVRAGQPVRPARPLAGRPASLLPRLRRRPDNPDYAYNLAVGLDRLNQPKLASPITSALALAQDKAVGFDRAALRALHELNTAS